MKRTNEHNEKGAAVILALILIAVLSVMAVSMMFLSQSEGWSSANYRLMSQARDGAEAGLNAAANHIVNTYVPPTDTGTDLLSAYTASASAVQGTNVLFNGAPVVLSADPNVSSNYNTAASAKQTAFNANFTGGKGTLVADNTTVNYYSSAKLISQTLIQPDAGVTPALDTAVQTWEITGRGTVAGVQGAEVQVSAILDRDFNYSPGTINPAVPGITTYTPVFPYVIFGTGNACGTLDFRGQFDVHSYDSQTKSGGVKTCHNPLAHDATCGYSKTTGANIGTNGSVSFNGNSGEIGGSVSSPLPGGAGACPAHGVSQTNNIDGSDTVLPAPIVYPNPPFPASVPVTTLTTLPNTATCPGGLAGCSNFNSTTCTAISGTTAATCTAAGAVAAGSNGAKGKFILQPGSYGNIGGGTGVYLVGGTYNFNSLGPGDSTSINVIPGTGPVLINVTGCGGNSGTASCSAYSSAGGAVATGTTSQYMTTFPFSTNINNVTTDATQLTIQYGGPTTMNYNGNGLINPVALYIPNADFTGPANSADFYGAIIAKSVSKVKNFYYDRNLGSCVASSPDCNATTTAGTPSSTNPPTTTVGNITMRQFTWKKF